MSATAQSDAGAGRRRLLRAGLVMTIAVGLANILNAVLQFALARILDPDEYALLAALFAIVIVAAIPPLAFQATAAREVSVRLARGDDQGAGVFLKGMLRSLLAWSSTLGIVGLGLALLAILAGADDPLAYTATAFTVAAALLIPVLWGGLQGAGRFRALSAAHVLLAGTRLLAGIVIALLGGGVGAVMFGVAAATIVTELVSIVPLRGMIRPAEAKRQSLANRANVSAALGLTALWALMFSDLLVVRLVSSGDEAGAYAAAAVASKVLHLMPIAATTVLFPRVAVLHDRVRERRHLLAGLGVVAAASTLLVAFVWVFAEPLIDVLFGSGYEDAAEWLGPLSLAMALYGFAMVYLYHFLALGRARFGAVLATLLAAQIVAYALFHDAPRDLVAVQIAFGAAAAVAGEVWYLVTRR